MMRFSCFLLLALASPLAGDATGTLGTPVESVIGLLEKLHTQITKEGKEEAASYDKFACFCKEQADEKLYVITKADKKIKRLTAEIEELEGDIKQLEAEEQTAQKEKDKNQEDIDAKKKARQEQLDEFLKMDGNLADIIKALKAAIKAMEESKGGMVGDADLSMLLKKTVFRHQKHAPSRRRLLAFLQQGQAPGGKAAFQYKSNDVIAMLKELLKDFTGDKRDGVSEEQQNKHDSDMSVNGLENLNEGLAELLAKNREIQGAKNDAMKSKTQDKEETETSRGQDQDFLDELTEQCEGKAKTFDQRSKARSDELKAIADALELLKGTVQGKYDANKKLVGLVVATKRAAAPGHGGGHWVWVEDNDDDHQAAEDDSREEVSFLQRRSKSPLGRLNRARSRKALRFLAAKADGLNSRALSTLVMKLKQGAGADHFVKVRGLINDLVKRLEEDAANEADHKAWCDENLENAVKNRDEQQQAIEKENGEITVGKAEIHKLKKEIGELSTEIADLDKAKKEAEEIRREEKKENTYTVEEATAGLEAVKQAIQLLKGFYENAFLQGGYEPFRAAGADASGKTVGDLAPDAGFDEEYAGKQEASKGIIGLLEVIQSDFERTIQTTEDNEEEAESKHETFLQDTDKDIEAKEGDKDTKEGEKKDEEADLVENEDQLVDAKDQKQNAIDELEKLKPTCIDTSMSWEERTKKREEEIEALKEALRILDTAFE